MLIALDAVEKFNEPECTTGTFQDVNVTFHWMVRKQWLSLALKVAHLVYFEHEFVTLLYNHIINYYDILLKREVQNYLKQTR